MAWFGSKPCDSISVVSSGEIDCSIPTDIDALVDVSVRCFASGANFTKSAAFTHYTSQITFGGDNHIWPGRSFVLPIQGGLAPYDVSISSSASCIHYDSKTKVLSEDSNCASGASVSVTVTDSVGTQASTYYAMPSGPTAGFFPDPLPSSPYESGPSAEQILLPNHAYNLHAQGGVNPFTFQVTSGQSSILSFDPTSLKLRTSNTSGTVIIRITDGSNQKFDATIPMVAHGYKTNQSRDLNDYTQASKANSVVEGTLDGSPFVVSSYVKSTYGGNTAGNPMFGMTIFRADDDGDGNSAHLNFPTDPSNTDLLMSDAQATDGSIYLVGYSINGRHAQGLIQKVVQPAPNSQAPIALDSRFGDHGKQFVQVRSGANETIQAIALEPSGTILLGVQSCTTSHDNTTCETELARLGAKGDLEGSLSLGASANVFLAKASNGTVLIVQDLGTGFAIKSIAASAPLQIGSIKNLTSMDFPGAKGFVSAIAANASRIIVETAPQTDFHWDAPQTLRAFHWNGSSDTSFGDGGVAVIKFRPEQHQLQATGLNLRPDGSLLIGGGNSFAGGK